MFGSGPLGTTAGSTPRSRRWSRCWRIAAWFGVLLQGWRRIFPAKLVGLALVGAALFVHPMYLLMQSRVLVGEGVQPRYVLPILVIFTGLSLLGARGTTLRLSPGRLLGHRRGARRWRTPSRSTSRSGATSPGLDVSKILFGDDLEWWWGSAPDATLVWLGASARLHRA